MTRRASEAAIALLLAGGTLAMAWWSAGRGISHQSAFPHFVLLADALLDGHLWVNPKHTAGLVDLTPHAGRLYVAFPPLPALLMLPFVAIAGRGFNDTQFTLVLGAANVALAYLVVRRMSLPSFAGPGVPLGRGQAMAVAALLALGSVHFYASLMGRVWFTAHIVSVTFLLLYLAECFGKGRPVVAGAALAAAWGARLPTVFGAAFWLVLALRHRPSAGQLVARLAQFVAPPLLVLALFLAQNGARFGWPFDFGYLTMGVAPRLAPDLRTYGMFNLHFLERNLRALFVTPPVVTAETAATWWEQFGRVDGLRRLFTTSGQSPGHPFPVSFDSRGTGLWAVSPALVFCLRRPRREDLPLTLAAWLSVAFVALPDLLYYNTGWSQYGYRFALDFLPFLLVLLALGLRRPLRGAWVALFAVLLMTSVVSNWLGARWFLRLLPY